MARIMRAIVVGVGVSLIACSAGNAEPKKNPGAAQADAASAAQLELAAREKARREWQTKLSGSRWDLEVTVSAPGRPQVVESDVLTFERGTVGSDTLDKAGYARAGYSLYPPTEESVGWEAMQSKQNKDVQEAAIWRGEVTGETMQGMLIKKRTDRQGNHTEQFSFTGKRMAPAPAESAEPAAASQTPSAAPAPAAGQSAPTAPQPSGSPAPVGS